MERPSYAGVQVEVLEHTDGRLQVSHEGEIIPSRPAPPKPGALRASNGALAPTPEISRIVKRLGDHRISQPQLRQLTNLNPIPSSKNQWSTTITVNPRLARNSPRDSWPSGRRRSRPRPKVSPCGQSRVNWAYTATRSASTPLPDSADQSAHQPWRQPNPSTSHQPLRLTNSLSI